MCDSAEQPQYKIGEKVELYVSEETDLGFKVLVDNAHWGMIYKNEIFQKIECGQEIGGYVKFVRSDSKIDISLHPPGYEKIEAISKKVFQIISELGGSTVITDKSPPESIYSQFGVSKKTFKKAIGALYKQRVITIEKERIKIVTTPIH